MQRKKQNLFARKGKKYDWKNEKNYRFELT